MPSLLISMLVNLLTVIRVLIVLDIMKIRFFPRIKFHDELKKMFSGFVKKRDFMPQMAQLRFNLTESKKLAEVVFTIEVLS